MYLLLNTYLYNSINMHRALQTSITPKNCATHSESTKVSNCMYFNLVRFGDIFKELLTYTPYTSLSVPLVT